MKLMKKISRFLIISVMMLGLIGSVFATSTTNPPSSCNAGWSSCSNAFANGGGTASATKGVAGIWNGYGFSLGGSDTVDSVSVRIDFYANKPTGYVDVQVSNNGGSSWGSIHQVGGVTSETTYNIDVTSDFSWTPGMLYDSNFRVRATCQKVGKGPNPTCRNDYMPVTVQSTPPIDNQPVANGSGAPTSGLEPLNVSFTGNFVPGDAPHSFLWQFMDGSNSTQQSPSHVFSAGVYNVSFTVTDNDLDSSTNYVLITVDADLTPVASASANPTSGQPSLLVNFIGGVSSGNGPFTFLWTFGDGTNSTSQNPSHTYTSSGLYTATFFVTDNDLDMDSNSVQINVTDPLFADLVISSLSFVEYVNGSNVTVVDVNWSITNVGDVFSGSFYGRLNASGITDKTHFVSGLTPSGSIGFIDTYLCSGNHTATAVADIFSQVTEYSEANNQDSTVIDCVV